MSEAPILAAEAVSKIFGATVALSNVDFSVRGGRVMALLGENGAGKSTLMKILAGIESPTAGALYLDGEPVELGSPTQAVDHGIAIIHQELNLFPNVSVTDNIFMAREQVRRGLVVDAQAERETAAALMERLEEPIDADTLVGRLRLGQQQIVEIARALLQDARVLIMDEPTSALSASEVEVLFRVIRELTASGVAVIYISHHLEEALEIADEVAVLRDGELVGQAEADSVDIGWVVERMVGRNPDELFPASEQEIGAELLVVKDLRVQDPSNPDRLAVDGVSLTVHAGEVVGLYGLMGAGRTELLETLAGRFTPVSGTISVEGEELEGGSVGDRVALGLALVPEDRQRDGLVQTMTVGDNLSLAGLRRFVNRFWVSSERERSAVGRAMSDVTVRASGPDAPIGSLSGGNQQKVVLGRALLTEPRVLLLDEPTRGIDVGAKAEIFGLMAEQARRGVAVLFATSELAEAINVPDRLLVMARGGVVREFKQGETTREELMVATGETAGDGEAAA